MRQLKKILLVLFLILLVFAGYVEIVNLNAKGMTYRQKLLKAVYPALMWFTRLTKSNTGKLYNGDNRQPSVSLYELELQMGDGALVSLNAYRGRKLLLVNTASDCGYTGQYKELQQLYTQYGDRLVVLGFPANDFKQQEKGSDEAIAGFCQKNFGVSFPLAKKSVVIPSPQQHPVYQWLTDPAKNGWCGQSPEWNFSKYLVDEEGVLLAYFGPSVSPLSSSITGLLENK